MPQQLMRACRQRVLGSAKYTGLLTTAKRQSGPIRTAIMSFSMASPKRMPASARMAWLKADGVTPNSAAALVKLYARATATKACRSWILGCAIDEIFSQPHQNAPH